MVLILPVSYGNLFFIHLAIFLGASVILLLKPYVQAVVNLVRNGGTVSAYPLNELYGLFHFFYSLAKLAFMVTI